jgi:hypothetical protein
MRRECAMLLAPDMVDAGIAAQSLQRSEKR